jgi:hypothetical protein
MVYPLAKSTANRLFEGKIDETQLMIVELTENAYRHLYNPRS